METKCSKCGGKTVSLADTEILKVAHHGSSGSSGEAFLQKLGVRDAVISVGANVFRMFCNFICSVRMPFIFPLSCASFC